MLTEKILKESKEFKEWIHGEVVLTHNIYPDTFIVIHKYQEIQKYYITRFFELGNKIQVSVDAQNKTAEEVFQILLSKY
jgi:hypothetical protein